MILLLCMTVGMFGVSCTGDDGAQGPPGPAGPQGPAGEPGESAGDSESNYPFLKTWGDADGRVACDDPLLTEEGMFPGEGLEMLPATTNTVRYAPAGASAETANGYVTVSNCGTGVFDAAPNPDFDGNGAGDLTVGGRAGDPFADTVALLFVKTHRGGDMNPVPQADQKKATSGVAGVSRTIQKSFTGGKFFAKMDATRAVGEVADRRDLYRDCDQGDGTAPPALEGEWRAVHIEEKHGNTTLNNNGLEVALDNSGVTRTTKKVCIRLDSLPGAVKCYVREEVSLPGTPVAGSIAAGVQSNPGTEKIIIYGDGTDSVVVDPKAQPATAAVEVRGRLLPADSTATENVQFIGDGNDFRGARLCNLFSETAQ